MAKHPRFYSEYTGPRLPSLDGTRASGALLLGVGYRFTGSVVGPIDPSLPASYAFGVDRGGAKAPMTINPPAATAGGGSGGAAGGGSTGSGTSLVMFTRRPDIFVDALVVVTTGPAGPSGTVQLMEKDGSTGPERPIPSQDVGISGNQVSVLVPAPLLPPNGAPPDQYYYAFWAASGDPTTSADVASFVPEYNITPIAVRRG